VTVPPGYVPLDASTVLGFAAPYLDAEPVEAAEIGDGNLNLVFRVQSASSSVIVKQALPYLRVAGEGWPLTLDRTCLEADAMRLHAQHAPGLAPQVLHVDETAAAVVLEDLHQHVVWRTAMRGGEDVAGVANALGRYCARTMIGTSSLVMPALERRQLALRFENPELSAISEDLVFTAPYIEASSNRYDEAAADLAAELRADARMRALAAQLRWEFRARQEALIHGDLHTGSVMVRDADLRVIDVEFATWGPMGYDTGNVIAHLGLARIARYAGGQGDPEAVDRDARAFWTSLCDEVGRVWPSGEPWRENFLAALLVDTARYAATEMVRRIVGLAHVADIDQLPDGARLQAQRAAVQAARSLQALPAAGTSTTSGRAAPGRRPDMKKLLNDPDDFVDEVIDGLLLAHGGQLRAASPDRRALVRADAPAAGRVGIVTGGGSGHLPVFLGYVGQGLCSGVAIGNVFSSPSPEQVLAATRESAGGAGVLYLYGNYGGDVFNFDLAGDLADAEDIETATVLVTDDVASAPPERADRRRGVAGMVFAFKCAGAAAERGGTLQEVADAARAAVAATRTMGVGLSPTILPAAGKPTFELADGEMEVGIGIHGEPGVRRGPLETADAVADQLVSAVADDLGLADGDRVAVLINGLGATPLEELYVLYRRVCQHLGNRSVSIERRWVGEYATSLEMAGASVSLMKVDDALLSLLDEPARSPFFRL